MDEDNGIVSWLIAAVLVIAAVYIAVLATCTIGVAIGAGFSLKNYVVSFVHNVKPRELDEVDLAADVA